jgi:DNA helicase II / ATP-dependent DNA helicase PcrA
MAISCVYCGAQHADATQVRECWQRTQAAAEHPAPDWADTRPAADVQALPEARAVSGTRDGGPEGPIAVRAMPGLGRNIIVRPGQKAPKGWATANRRPITTADLADVATLIAELQTFAHDRVARVLEIDDAVVEALAAPESTTSSLHTLGPRFAFERSTVRHLLWSNAFDARNPGQPAWSVLTRAMELGGLPVASTDLGDVIVPGGSVVWLDGGPIRHTGMIDGLAVLHRVAVEHGSLAPFGSAAATADLAADQLAAVSHSGGAARVIAPAGSGKTRVLTERARHLVADWRLPASSVCLVAFNKRAQEEMSDRIRDLRGVQVRTLNAIALAIVNGSAPFARQPVTLTTIPEIDVRRLIGKLVEFPRKRNSDPVAMWIEGLSLARLGLRNPNDVEALYDGDIDGFAEFVPRYREELALSRSLDYDEQIVRAIEMLLADPATRRTAQRACQVLLVDEFQDLTPAHLLLVRLLAGPDGCVFGVGDDDQTIYGFNGADPQWLIDFAALFPYAGEHPLEVNYRCPGDVVAAADMLLQHNTRRVAKTIRGASADAGLAIDVDDDAVAATVRVVTTALEEGRPATDIAVLTRVNSLLTPVQIALGMAGVATHGGVGTEFAERAAVRGSLAWLRLATSATTMQRRDLEEALRNPSRPVRPNVAAWVAEQTSIDGLRRLAGRLNTPREAERVEAFADDIERLRRLASSGGSTSAILSTLHESMGMASTLSTLDTHRRGMNRAAQSDDLTAVAQLAALQPDPAAFEGWLRAELGRGWQADGVTLATVHRVKGKEWPVVVVHQAAADQFPHRLATDVEEERRVFHVAITRGRWRVHIHPGARPSPFIEQCFRPPDPAALAAARIQPGKPVRSAGPVEKPGSDLNPSDTKLFEELRATRRHLAAGKPAYTVVSDKTLNDIARCRPTTLAELGDIKGMGPVKLERYGDALLAVVDAATG